MKTRRAELFADAIGIWRADRELLHRAAAVLFFLPAFGAMLFVPPFDAREMDEAQAAAAMLEWLRAYGGWAIGLVLVQAFGTAVLLVLLTDSARPSLGGAMVRAIAKFPALLASWLILLAAICAALLLLGPLVQLGGEAMLGLVTVPLLYLAARAFLAGPVIVAEGLGPLRGLVESIRRTRGNGWALMLALALVHGGYYLIALTGQAGLIVIGPGNVIATAAITAGIALAGAVSALALVLLQVAAYRALSKQGI